MVDQISGRCFDALTDSRGDAQAHRLHSGPAPVRTQHRNHCPRPAHGACADPREVGTEQLGSQLKLPGRATPASGGRPGLTGATWAAETSVIGSGWLFAAWKAAYSTGTASILAWILAGTAIIILALVHAELGSMYPVAGGTARFPHFAFGTVAGTSFGFFSWVQAITVPAIGCFAVMQYAS
jgi:Amino acid permease